MARNQKSVILSAILRKRGNTTSTIPPSTKCLLLEIAVFLEKEFVSEGASGRKVELEEALTESNTGQVTEAVAEKVPQEVMEQPTTTTTQAPRKSSRIHHQPERY